MDQPEELKLIEKFKSGDVQAFNQLVLRYQEKIYWIVRRIIPDHAAADDVVQDVFIKAYRSLPGFKGDSSFYTWIYRIAINLSLNEVRRRKLRQAFSIEQDDIHIGTEDSTPAELLEKKELQKQIQQAIARLPEKQKKVFLLRYYEELPYEEISKILNTSVGGLKANYFHAVKKIGEYIRRESK
jgi:RNA polymerase sigma-70 factor (ECF subfamily)